MAGPYRSGTSEVGQEAAVIGVVIAGVLASFTFPGPFDWGSTLIGLLLLGVLIAYGSAPTEARQWRRALGGAVGLAFCILLIIGRPLDQIVDEREPGANSYWLSGWTAEKVRASETSRAENTLPPSPPQRRIEVFQATGTAVDRPSRDDADRPARAHGDRLLGVWAFLVAVIMAAWRFWWVPRRSQADEGFRPWWSNLRFRTWWSNLRSRFRPGGPICGVG